MNASKKARTALRAKKRSAAEQHDSPDEPVWLAPTAGGASAGIVARHLGIMPVAVVLFTALSFVSFWRAAPIVSEAAKSLIDIHYGEAKLAGMLPPPDASRREGNTSYWPEAKVWAKKAWLIEAIGSDAVRFAEANGTLEQVYKRQRGRWHDARRKIMVRALLSSPLLSSPLLSSPLLSSPLLSSPLL